MLGSFVRSFMIRLYKCLERCNPTCYCVTFDVFCCNFDREISCGGSNDRRCFGVDGGPWLFLSECDGLHVIVHAVDLGVLLDLQSSFRTLSTAVRRGY